MNEWQVKLLLATLDDDVHARVPGELKELLLKKAKKEKVTLSTLILKTLIKSL